MVSVTLKAVSQDPVLHTVRLTLFANSPRIEIEDSIHVNFADVKTWTFGFDLKNQTTRHEELGAIITAKKNPQMGSQVADIMLPKMLALIGLLSIILPI